MCVCVCVYSVISASVMFSIADVSYNVCMCVYVDMCVCRYVCSYVCVHDCLCVSFIGYTALMMAQKGRNSACTLCTALSAVP